MSKLESCPAKVQTEAENTSFLIVDVSGNASPVGASLSGRTWFLTTLNQRAYCSTLDEVQHHTLCDRIAISQSLQNCDAPTHNGHCRHCGQLIFVNSHASPDQRDTAVHGGRRCAPVLAIMRTLTTNYFALGAIDREQSRTGALGKQMGSRDGTSSG